MRSGRNACGCLPLMRLRRTREGKEDLKWSTIAPKPCYTEEMESGVFCFVVRSRCVKKIMVFKLGISQRSQQRRYDDILK